MSLVRVTKIDQVDLRVIKRGFRPGDKAPAAQIEFVKENVSDSEELESLTEETA